ncbi:hypothetical protein L2E82_27221 [Cichorium intybus]|uniref:Uncharacterized protein n=1 Tax=Cichorium intybus TaxID=13427 RepID=A0ACB9CSP3_CICIN|nr:hypothetical protein L2E82_27221 [Cichorium intybus]
MNGIVYCSCLLFLVDVICTVKEVAIRITLINLPTMRSASNAVERFYKLRLFHALRSLVSWHTRTERTVR